MEQECERSMRLMTSFPSRAGDEHALAHSYVDRPCRHPRSRWFGLLLRQGQLESPDKAVAPFADLIFGVSLS